MAEQKKTKTKYHNQKSHDDTLRIVLNVLGNARDMERASKRDYKIVLRELIYLYEENYNSLYKDKIVNKRALDVFLKSSFYGGNQLDEQLDLLKEALVAAQTKNMILGLSYAYTHTIAETQKSIKPDLQKVAELSKPEIVSQELERSWCADGKTVLDRLNININTSFENAQTLIYQGLENGWSIDKMTRMLREVTGIAQYKASRLIRTESMAVWGKATKNIYLENGIEYVEIVGDAECGGICLDYVGGAIPLREAEIGDELPPYHPNCACSFCAYDTFENTEE